MNGFRNSLKYVLGLVGCILFRFIPMPAPNIEPIMAVMLPYAKSFGRWAGAAFAFLALVAIDFITGRLGLWTLYTGLAYGAIGYAAARYFASVKGRVGAKHFVGFAVVGTLFYDLVTALLFGWQFGQPLSVTLVGQIPFTAYHLLGNVVFTALLSPLISRYVVENESLALDYAAAKG